MAGVEGAHWGQKALSAVLAGFVGVTTTFTLTSNFFAFSVRNVAHQSLDAPFFPIRHDVSDGIDFGHQTFADYFAPVATIADFRHRAHLAACWAIVRSASFLFGIDVEASIFAVTFAASGFETAISALFGNLHTGRCGQQTWG